MNGYTIYLHLDTYITPHDLDILFLLVKFYFNLSSSSSLERTYV